MMYAIFYGGIMKQRHQISPIQASLQPVCQKTKVILDNTPEGAERDKALIDAFFREDVEAVKALLVPENGVRGANPNVMDHAGRTLYHLARRWGWHEMRGLLARHGGKIIRNNKVLYQSFREDMHTRG